MENMSLEEKVHTLEERVEKLEKIEKRRKTWKWVKLFVIVALYVALIVVVYLGYRYVKTTYLDPITNWKSNVQENLDGLKGIGDIFGGLGL